MVKSLEIICKQDGIYIIKKLESIRKSNHNRREQLQSMSIVHCIKWTNGMKIFMNTR
jgi:hypothetical protein